MFHSTKSSIWWKRKDVYKRQIKKHLVDFDEKFRKVSLIKTAATREEAAKERALKMCIRDRKNYVPEKPDSVLNTIITTMRSLPKKVYVSDSLKAIIDLEIDLLLESGGVLQHCERCGEYFIRDKDYDYDYCSKAQPGGRTCLEMSTAVPPRTPDEIRRLEDMTKELYTYMSVSYTHLDVYKRQL